MAEPIKTIVGEELNALRAAIASNIMANGQNASGRTIRSLRVESREDGGTLYGRAPFATMERGRKGGKVPRKFHEIIYQWMMDRGIHGTPYQFKTTRPHKRSAQEAGDRTLAYFIGEQIRKQGTKLFRDGGRADVYSNVIPTTLKAIRSRLLGIVNAEFKTIKLNKA